MKFQSSFTESHTVMSVMLQCFTIVHVLGLGVCASITQSERLTLVLCVCTDVFVKRRRTALWCSVSLFGLSGLILVVGLLAATQTDNVAVSGYYPGIIVSEEKTSHYFNELCFVLFIRAIKHQDSSSVSVVCLSLKVCRYLAER